MTVGFPASWSVAGGLVNRSERSANIMMRYVLSVLGGFSLLAFAQVHAAPFGTSGIGGPVNDVLTTAEDVTIAVSVVGNDTDQLDCLLSGNDPIDTLSVTTQEDMPLEICFNATDIEGDTLDSINSFLGPEFGVITGEADGDTCITYTPDPDYNGGDTVTVVICDTGGLCDTLLVVIDVTSVNDPPEVTDVIGQPTDTVAANTTEDTPIEICLNAIDTDGDSLQVTGLAGGMNNGSASGLADGDTCWTYIPDPDFNGTDTADVIVCDNNGGCDTVTVVIEITPANDVPVIVDGGFVSIDTTYASSEANTAISICLTALDVDGDTLDVTAVSGPPNGVAGSFGDGDTCFTYTPDPGFIGTDTLTAYVCDGSGACDSVLVIIEVTGPNNPPIIVDEDFTPTDTLEYTTPEDLPVTICLTAIDFDGDTLDVTNTFGGPLNGAVNGTADGDTCFTYTPDPDWNGTDTLSVVVCDNHGGCDTVLVIIQVAAVNAPPIIVDGGNPVDTLHATTPEGTPITICLDAIDVEDDTLDVTAVVNAPGNGTTSGIADGDTCFTYTPDPGFTGTDTVTVVLCDNPGACDTVTVVIDVTPVNEPPIAVDDTATTPLGTPVIIDILANDSDPDGDPLTITATGAQNGWITVNGDGTITYTPNPGFCGIDTIFYQICDPGMMCDNAIVVVDVSCPGNQPPIAVDDVANTDSGVQITVTVLGNDSDPEGDPITVTSANAGNGNVVINGDGTLTYTPDPGFCGSDTIVYVICDPEPLCDQGLVVIIVECPPVNDPPIAVDDSTGTEPDTPLTIDVLDNDSDPNGDPLTVTTADAANGTVTINNDGTLNFIPADGFCGIDTVTYTACDPGALCDEATVLVTVVCPDTIGLLIPQGFSPNGDGYGDTWTIVGLEDYPRARITIFNRWGNEVYSGDPYGNAWDGRSIDALTWDGVLPVGTYWFLLDLGMEDGEVRTGYIYLNR